MQDRFHTNIKLLRPYMSVDLFQVLRSSFSDEVLSRYRADSGFNDIFHTIGLYEPSPDVFCKQQFKNYDFDLNEIKFHNDFQISLEAYNNARHLAHIILNEWRKTNPQIKEAPHFSMRGNFVSLGLGLGHHLPIIMEEIFFKNLIIVEPNLDFLLASLVQLDWAPIVAKIEKANGQINFIIHDDERAIAEGIKIFFQDKYFPLIEGSCIYCHYQSASIQKILRLVDESKHQMIAYNGWIEDEYFHLANHLENTSNKDIKLLSGLDIIAEKKIANGAACFVIASGPSLDEAISHIKNRKESATILSCGTALRPLLAAGITPDFQVELENNKTTAHTLIELSKEYDLSNISLICPTNIVPQTCGVFKEELFYLRESDGPLKALTSDLEQLDSTAPSPSNTAFRIAELFGFSYCFLFGVDFGLIDGKHHSETSVYNANNYADMKLLSGSGNDDKNLIKVQGNFDKDIYSNPLWIFMRNSLEHLIVNSKLKTFNCGEGSKIDGSDPVELKIFDQIDFLEKPHDIDARLAASFEIKHIHAHSYFEKLKTLLSLSRQSIKQLSTDIDDLLSLSDELLSEDRIYKKFEKNFHAPLSATQNTIENGFQSAYGGSLTPIFHVLRFIALRSTDPASGWRFGLETLNKNMIILDNLVVKDLEVILSKYDICQPPTKQL